MIWRMVLMILFSFCLSNCGSDSLLDGTANQQESDFILSLPNGVQMEFVSIPPDTLMIGKYEVTQAQWVSIMKSEPWLPKDREGANNDLGIGPNFPAKNIWWYGVQEFLEELNRLDPNGIYRLPTEAEWEYACSGGALTDFWFGDEFPYYDVEMQLFADERYVDYMWFRRNAEGHPHEVGLKPSNSFGLYDMHGNVQELVDTFVEEPFSIGIQIIPGMWDMNILPSLVFKGGTFALQAEACKTKSVWQTGRQVHNGLGTMIWDASELRGDSGFRVVRQAKK